MSNEFFNRVLSSLHKQGQEFTPNYIHVLKRLVLSQTQLRLYSDCEESLEKIIEITQKITTSDALIYKEYNNLFTHCIRFNLNKAILLGKALLSENEIKKIPIAYQKTFIFNLGTAYLLKGNFVDAKARLREALTMDPNNFLKGFALNNLAVASWWHKHPNFREEENEDEHEHDQLESADISHSIHDNT